MFQMVVQQFLRTNSTITVNRLFTIEHVEWDQGVFAWDDCFTSVCGNASVLVTLY